MPTLEANQQLLAAADAADSRKAEEIRILALDPNESSLTDYFLICTGTNDRQTGAIADEIEARLKRDFGVYPNSVEGRRQGEWVLMDYVDFVVHIFLPEKRAYYGLERLRKTATPLTIGELNEDIQEALAKARSKPRKTAAAPAPAKPVEPVAAPAPVPLTFVPLPASVAPAPVKAAPVKTVTKKTAPKKTATPAKKAVPAKKPVAAKKSVAKPAAKKAVAKKAAAKKAAPKKASAPAKKAAPKKAAPAKKSVAKKATAKKATGKKAVAKKSVAKKTAPKKKK